MIGRGPDLSAYHCSLGLPNCGFLIVSLSLSLCCLPSLSVDLGFVSAPFPPQASAAKRFFPCRRVHTWRTERVPLIIFSFPRVFILFFSYSAPPYSSLIFFGRRCSLGCIVPCTLGSLFPSSLFLSNVVAWILMAQLARTAAAFSLYSVSLIIQCVTGRHLLAALSVALRHR